MKLKRLKLRNFKGLTFEVVPDGADIAIHGRNMAGKTRLYDAFLWLLFGKDSRGRSDFDVLPYGSPEGVEVEVEAVLDSVTLKKVYKAKWTRKRGESERRLTGHTTEHYLDGEPVSASAYKTRIKSICDESLFKLLTNPRYFMEMLKPDDRRAMLLGLAGDPPEPPADIAAILDGKSLESRMVILKRLKRDLDDERETIPVRIDEVARELEQMEPINLDEVNAEIDRIDGEIEKLRQKKSDIQNNVEVSRLRAQIADLELELKQAQAEYYDIQDTSAMELYREALQKWEEEESEIRTLRGLIEQINGRIKWARGEKHEIERRINALREEYRTFAAEQFANPEIDTICPTCGQELPDDQIEEARAKAKAEYNRRKSEKLADIQKRGKEKADALKEVEAEIERLNGELTDTEKRLAELKQSHGQKPSEPPKPTPYTDTADYTKRVKEINLIRERIDDINRDMAGAIAKIDDQILTLQTKRRELNNAIALANDRERKLKRLNDLKSQQRKVGQDLQEVEQQIFRLEEWNRERLSAIEEQVAKHFRLARFRLFELQINGGVRDVCILESQQGTPWNNMSNAERINHGLDVIDTFGRIKQFKPPIFVDNAEAVVELYETEAQQIRLVVDASAEKLEVKHD